MHAIGRVSPKLRKPRALRKKNPISCSTSSEVRITSVGFVSASQRVSPRYLVDLSLQDPNPERSERLFSQWSVGPTHPRTSRATRLTRRGKLSAIPSCHPMNVLGRARLPESSSCNSGSPGIPKLPAHRAGLSPKVGPSSWPSGGPGRSWRRAQRAA